MGIFNAVTGNSSLIKDKDLEKLNEKLSPMFASGEEIVFALKTVRDMSIFTNKRIIIIDKQGVTGKKVQRLSIPYKSITMFSLESAGHFDLDGELKIYSNSFPTQNKFYQIPLSRFVNTNEIMQLISDNVLN